MFCTSKTAVKKAPAEESGVCLLFMTSTYLQHTHTHTHSVTHTDPATCAFWCRRNVPGYIWRHNTWPAGTN